MRFERVLDLAWRVMVGKKIVRPQAQKEGQEILMQVYAAGYEKGRSDRMGWNKRPVLQIKGMKVINEFESITDAAKFTGVSRNCIWGVCNGKRPSAGGYKWKYKN